MVVIIYVTAFGVIVADVVVYVDGIMSVVVIVVAGCVGVGGDVCGHDVVDVCVAIVVVCLCWWCCCCCCHCCC